MEVKCIVNGPWRENCYVVSNADGVAVVIDPGGEFPAICSYIAEHGLKVQAVLNTHAHYDHLGAVADVKKHYKVPFYLHSADSKLLKSANFYRKLFLGEQTITIPEVDSDLSGVELLNFQSLEVEVFHTPGHTPGGVCFRIGDELITGDTILAEHIGRTDLPGGDREQLVQSIHRLHGRFGGSLRIHPGHGGSTTLSAALANNQLGVESRQ